MKTCEAWEGQSFVLIQKTDTFCVGVMSNSKSYWIFNR